MEEPVAENGGSQELPPPPPPNTNVGRSDWMDLGGFSALICELQEEYHKFTNLPFQLSQNILALISK